MTATRIGRSSTTLSGARRAICAAGSDLFNDGKQPHDKPGDGEQDGCRSTAGSFSAGRPIILFRYIEAVLALRTKDGFAGQCVLNLIQAKALAVRCLPN